MRTRLAMRAYRSYGSSISSDLVSTDVLVKVKVSRWGVYVCGGGLEGGGVIQSFKSECSESGDAMLANSPCSIELEGEITPAVGVVEGGYCTSLLRYKTG